MPQRPSLSQRLMSPPVFLLLGVAALTAATHFITPTLANASLPSQTNEQQVPREAAANDSQATSAPVAQEKKKAPKWEVPTWGNLPKGTNSLEVDDYAGKTIYLYCFQSWCPGCHSSGFPTLKKVKEHYKDNDDVVFLAVQTVFEGFSTNTHTRGMEVVTEKFKLDIPVGHSGSKAKPSKLMRNYKTRGTPWTIIIGPDGVQRYGEFHIKPDQAIKLIAGLQKDAE